MYMYIYIYVVCVYLVMFGSEIRVIIIQCGVVLTEIVFNTPILDPAVW